MTTTLSIDRFEGSKKEIAVLVTDDSRSINLPRWLLPKDAKAGDVVNLSIERDVKRTATTRAFVAKTRKVPGRPRQGGRRKRTSSYETPA